MLYFSGRFIYAVAYEISGLKKSIGEEAGKKVKAAFARAEIKENNPPVHGARGIESSGRLSLKSRPMGKTAREEKS